MTAIPYIIAAKDALKLEGGFKNIEKVIAAWGPAGRAVAGGLMMAGGTGIYFALSKIADKGKELINQQEQLARVGVSLNDVNPMTADYFSGVAKSVPTAKVSEYLKVIRELRAVTGTTESAAAFAPQAMKINALLGNSLGGTQTEAFYTLLRSAEMKGIATNPEKLDQFINSSVPLMMAFGGKLKPGDFQTFARRGGAAWVNTDIAKSMTPMAVAMADLGGSTAGQSIMSLNQAMMGAMTFSRQQGTSLRSLV